MDYQAKLTVNITNNDLRDIIEKAVNEDKYIAPCYECGEMINKYSKDWEVKGNPDIGIPYRLQHCHCEEK